MRNKTDIPLALHTSGVELLNGVKKGSCDMFNTGGTMRDFMKNGYIADLAGIPVWHGSGVDLGVLEASYLHACAATENATLSSDIFGEFCRFNDLIVEPIEIENGFAKIPEKPGLGVELDEEAIEKYRINKRTNVS